LSGNPNLPVGRGRPAGSTSYNAGSTRAVVRLRNLNFDPIGKLVERYNALEKDVENYRKIRSGELVELLGNGKPRAFSYDVLLQMEQRLIDISEKLLRYGYGRVPEAGGIEAPKLPTLHISLTKPGETFVINQQSDEDFDYIDNEAEL
jgi:hypothetical protein